MLVKLFFICVSVQTVLSRPQLVTYKDGTFGVNFAGYHAEAGLGGLLTGNAAHGGLHASAGTPHGQMAGAGIGGTVNGEGRTGGGGYAGASAGYGVGASAAFGGGLNSETGGGGGVGAESHVPGLSTKVVKLSEIPSQQTTIVKTFNSNVETKAPSPDSSIDTRFNGKEEVEQLQPPKKKTTTQNEVYTPSVTHIFTSVRPNQPHDSGKVDTRNFFDFGVFSNAAAAFGGPHSNLPSNTQPQLEKRFNAEDQSSTSHGQGGAVYTKTVAPRPNLFDDIFNIPISTLQAVNRLLNNSVQRGVSYRKTVDASYG